MDAARAVAVLYEASLLFYSVLLFLKNWGAGLVPFGLIGVGHDDSSICKVL